MALVAMIAMALESGSFEIHADTAGRPTDAASPRQDSPASRERSATATCTVEIEEPATEDIARVDAGPMVRPVRYDGTHGRQPTIRRLGARARVGSAVGLSEQTIYECDEEFEEEPVISENATASRARRT